MIKLTKKAILLSAAVFVAGSGSYTLSANGAMTSISQAIIESRCDAGAFIQHSSSASAVAADSQSTDVVTPQASIVSSNPPGTNDKVLSGNLIPNPSVDYGNNSEPTGWQNNVYDQNTADFSLVAGDNSQSAVRTTVSNYVSGDADWYYKFVSVKPGAYYRYSDEYRSNTSTRAILALKDSSGHMSYIDLAATGPASNWTKYQDTFFIPQNITSAMVFHPLAANGYLDLDNFSLNQIQPQEFASPVVTLTFDDGWSSIHDNALPLLKAFNMPSTQYIISGYLGQDKSYMNVKDVYDFKNSGSEIASHTVDHVDLTKQDPAKLTSELKNSQAQLGKCFGTPVDFAEPYGTFNATTTTQVKQYYETARSTDTGFNTADNFNPYALLVQNVTAQTTEAQVNAWLETAKQNNAWLILVYHQVDNSGTEFSRSPANLKSDLEAVKASGISVETMHTAYSQLVPQATSSK